MINLDKVHDIQNLDKFGHISKFFPVFIILLQSIYVQFIYLLLSWKISHQWNVKKVADRK